VQNIHDKEAERVSREHEQKQDRKHAKKQQKRT